LAEGHKQLAGGTSLEEVCRHLEIAESTWHRWRAQYGGMKANDAKRLKELGGENARLKNPLAEAELDNSMLKERRGKLLTPTRRRCAVEVLKRSTDRRARPLLAEKALATRCFARRHDSPGSANRAGRGARHV
jgi:transposase-like protein